jgi:DNA-binding transcriptional regulator GbsR (MarR family)
MPYITTEIDVDLSDFATEDLLEELRDRQEHLAFPAKEIINIIYEKRRINQDYQKELNNLIYEVLGKII